MSKEVGDGESLQILDCLGKLGFGFKAWECVSSRVLDRVGFLEAHFNMVQPYFLFSLFFIYLSNFSFIKTAIRLDRLDLKLESLKELGQQIKPRGPEISE